MLVNFKKNGHFKIFIGETISFVGKNKTALTKKSLDGSRSGKTDIVLSIKKGTIV